MRLRWLRQKPTHPDVQVVIVYAPTGRTADDVTAAVTRRLAMQARTDAALTTPLIDR